jgi:hypothetical protein
MSPTTRMLGLGLVLGALLAPVAHASSTQSSIMMDDDQVAYRDDATASRTLSQMKQLGVDTVRVTVLWKVVADNAKLSSAEIKKIKSPAARTAARAQAKRFRASDPKTYPQLNWDRYDGLVRSAQSIGIRVYFNVTGPGPSWSHAKTPRSLAKLGGAYKPSPSLFKQYVAAVGRRFSGGYTDENGCRCKLPRVNMWSLWNEPNQASWLAPQWAKVGGSLIPVAPRLFRRLHQFGYRGLVASGHRIDTDTILLGETAPLGSRKRSAKSPLLPGVFLRELACVKSNGRSYTGAAAKLRGCRDFRTYGALNANGYAHHPYTKNVPTTTRPADSAAITMANIANLGRLLDKLSTRTGGKIPRGLALYMTEFGFETNPPDPFSGVSFADQARYDTLGEHLAYKNPRIAAQAQFLLRDARPVAGRPKASKSYWFTYQSGLYLADGKPKLSAFAYALPFLATRNGGGGPPSYSLWGQLRFLPDGTAARAVVQYKRHDAPESAWTTNGAPINVSQRGYFTAGRTAPVAGPIDWRGAWLKDDGTVGFTSLPSSGS